MRVLSLFFAFIIFVQGLLPLNSVFEMAKISDLIRHYQLHQQNETTHVASFLDFLEEHYGGVDKHGHNHKNLPFKHTISAFDITFEQIQHLKIDFKVTYILETKSFFSFKNSFIPSFFCSIWQPPQL